MTDTNAMKQTVQQMIDSVSEDLRSISLSIHGKPELRFEEHHAHQVLTDYLAANGFHVNRGAYDMPTAFEALAGSGGPTIAVMCEYDALPGIGHACGHNLIAISGIAVGLALKQALGDGNGTIVVLGSPAEEGGGGKIRLAERGAFANIDAAMMLHPAPVDSAWFNSTATMTFEVAFHGKNAHAGGMPWEGVNAMDAIVMAHSAIGLLRQQLRPTDRVTGMITNGGQAVNIIPDYASALYGIRVRRHSELEALQEKVTNCFKAAALATGCRLELTSTIGYADMRANEPMALTYMENFAALGGKTVPAERARREPAGGATDMGDVSYLVPSIHPSFAIPVTVGTANHTAGFTACAATGEAHEATLRAAKALAMTAVELFANPDLLESTRAEFAKITR